MSKVDKSLVSGDIIFFFHLVSYAAIISLSYLLLFDVFMTTKRALRQINIKYTKVVHKTVLFSASLLRVVWLWHTQRREAIRNYWSFWRLAYNKKVFLYVSVRRHCTYIFNFI